MHVAPEGTDDAAGHGWKFEVGKAKEGGNQVYVMSVHRGGARGVNRGNFLSWIDPNDTEGEGVGGASSIPPAPMTTRLRGSTAGVLKPDASGSWTLHLDDNQG